MQMQWSIRQLLNPVITRVLLFGTNPIDLEYVLRQVEKTPLLNGKALEKTWMDEWNKKIQRVEVLAREAEQKSNRESIYQYNMLLAQYYYACYQINSDDIDSKRRIYDLLNMYYKKALDSRKNKTELLQIPVTEDKNMYAYLQLPEEKKDKYPCVIYLTGIGSCKEEMEMLSRPLVDRSIAVLTCDTPGTGESLFKSGLACNPDVIEKSFACIIDTLNKRADIDEMKLAACGLCMGGAYAYRMAAQFEQVKCCASLFPLFFEYLSDSSIPRWMKQGKWALFQNGASKVEEAGNFMTDMARMSNDPISCDYLMVHSVYDNWMKLEELNSIYERSKGYKEQILIDEEPVYASKDAVMHAMPVGEQLHWVKHVVADWIMERVK